MGTKITEIDYTELVKIYNSGGKLKADEYIKNTYSLSTGYVYQRLLKAGYTYNRTHKKYVQVSSESDNFLSLETLLEPMAPAALDKEKSLWEVPSYTTEIDTLVMELIKDKLLQLNHFMKINHHSKTVVLRKSALLEDGYKIIEC